MQLGFQLSLPDIVSLAGLFLTGFGLIFAALQIRQNNVSRRAEIMLAVINRYFGNLDERQMYYKLDYNEFVFDPDNFIGSDDERSLDGILYNLNAIGRLLHIGAISIKEVRLLDFEIHRILNNPEVKKYLVWLETEVEAHRIAAEPFKDIGYLERRLFKAEALQAGESITTR